MFKFILSASLILLIACSEKKEKTDKSQSQFSLDLPDSTVLRFLKWYHQNEDEIQQIHFFKGGLKDTTTFYSVDYDNTEKYLSKLLSSGCLSNKFISDMRAYFSQGDKYLKDHPQNDGPVDGFDYDLIMKSQDYMDVWSNLDSMKTIRKNILKDKATIKVAFGKYYVPNYNLTKIEGRWLIDSIYNVYEDN